MARTVNWGILGTGNIAKKFAEGMYFVKRARILAVGSRLQETADKFAEQFDIPRRYEGYEELVKDPDIQVVYISTPNQNHVESAIMCLNAGKAVLCEKPFAINAIQADKMFKAAKHNKALIMEAMWTRFLPIHVTLRDMLKKGVIGVPEMVTANFGFKAVYKPDGRLFDPELGGGSLLDIGVYPVSLAHMIFGAPNEVKATAHTGNTQVDETTLILLRHSDNKLSSLYSSIRLQTSHEAEIHGSKGRIRIHAPWWHPTKMTVYIPGTKEQEIELPYTGNGYNYEIEEVNNCLLKGKLESDIMPHDETLAVMETLDKIRAQIGLKFPME